MKWIWIVFLLGFNGYSQTDSLFSKAQHLAFDGAYDQSIELLKSQSEVRSRKLLARVYAWSSDYEASLKTLDDLIKKFPKDPDNFVQAATVSLWSGNWQFCLDYSNQGLILGEREVELSLLKIKALIQLQRLVEAEQLAKICLVKFPNEKEFVRLYQSIRQKRFQKEFIAWHQRDCFSLDIDPWWNSTYSLKNKTTNGPLILTINRAQRFGQTGFQGSAEWYPKLTKNISAYLEGGLSNSSLFPNYRWGGSLFWTLGSGFGLETGIRHLDYRSLDQVWFYVAQLDKYVGNVQFSYRFMAIQNKIGPSATHGLIAKYFLDDEKSYLALELGSGTNAMDYGSFSSYNPFQYMKSKRIQLSYKQRINYRLYGQCAFGFEKAEYFTNVDGNRISGSLGIGIRF